MDITARYIHRQRAEVSRTDREIRNGHRSGIFWFTGLPGSGKSTIAHALEKRLHDMGVQCAIFDGDNVRHGLCADLGFSPQERTENLRRIGETCALFAENGIVCLCAFIAPHAEDRAALRSRLGRDYHEIYVNCPLEICEQRDVKGNYQRARAGFIPNYTGISSPYDEPESPDLVLHTACQPPEASAAMALALILEHIKHD